MARGAGSTISSSRRNTHMVAHLAKSDLFEVASSDRPGCRVGALSRAGGLCAARGDTAVDATIAAAAVAGGGERRRHPEPFGTPSGEMPPRRPGRSGSAPRRDRAAGHHRRGRSGDRTHGELSDPCRIGTCAPGSALQPYPSSTLTRCIPKFSESSCHHKVTLADESKAAASPVTHRAPPHRPRSAFLSFLGIFLYLPVDPLFRRPTWCSWSASRWPSR